MGVLEVLQWVLIILLVYRVISLEIRLDNLHLKVFRSRYAIRDEVADDIKTSEIPAIRQDLLNMVANQVHPNFNVQPLVTRTVQVSQPMPVPVMATNATMGVMADGTIIGGGGAGQCSNGAWLNETSSVQPMGRGGGQATARHRAPQGGRPMRRPTKPRPISPEVGEIDQAELQRRIDQAKLQKTEAEEFADADTARFTVVTPDEPSIIDADVVEEVDLNDPKTEILPVVDLPTPMAEITASEEEENIA